MIKTVFIRSNALPNIDGKTLEMSDLNCIYGNHESGKSALLSSLTQLLRTGALQPNMSAIFDELTVTMDNGDIYSWKDGRSENTVLDNVVFLSNLGMVTIYSKFIASKVDDEARMKKVLDTFDKYFGAYFDGTMTLEEIKYSNLSKSRKFLLCLLGILEFSENKPVYLIVDDIDADHNITVQRNIITAMQEINPDHQLICSFRSPALLGNRRDSMIGLDKSDD
ncbi:hypothetical protein [Vibrio harveyi]|uniref:hypothetical protein n=1 Tax=Vibrio harveyi TaxID=669 RepID=UPI003CE86CAD